MIEIEKISSQDLKSSLLGYNKKETEQLLLKARTAYEQVYKENIELKDKISVLSEGVQYYKNMEKTLQKALVLAEKTTAETMAAAEAKAKALESESQAKADALNKTSKSKAENIEKEATLIAEAKEKEARTKADAILKGAKTKADALITASNEELTNLHNQIISLAQQYEKYKSQFKQLASSQLELLESDAYKIQISKLNTISVVPPRKRSSMREEGVSQPHSPIKEGTQPRKTTDSSYGLQEPKEHVMTTARKVTSDNNEFSNVHGFFDTTQKEHSMQSVSARKNGLENTEKFELDTEEDTDLKKNNFSSLRSGLTEQRISESMPRQTTGRIQ